MKSYKLDKEEEQILKDIEAGKYKSVSNLREEMKKAREAAQNTLNKTKNINIRLTVKDINDVKTKAMEAGLPYQTLIAALIRQYASGKLQISI
ncbi:MAG: hypothetical protein UR89_C0026G0013 [Candidatus Roizmanbacteria bacterium GW2011_GWA2_35_8]|uniref:Antitoxin n=1 Tax=Candidatus Roizmanbacteria bacterium GW2011_GWA2_35_8 TaxID=1618479 RepID=A0A0G0FFS7_9BACT|nr:MAG: hypothetical protein UR89_C0026G0013 [Candidatus Roizmanbacteria bacterium GW2011_GWA2_35_8]